jgi:hypothetical protein
MNRRKRAQTALEYSLVIAVVVLALIAMQIYMRRGMSGKLRDVADSLGKQYWPGATDSDLLTTQQMEVRSEVLRVEGNTVDPEYDNYYVTTQTERIIRDIETKTGHEEIKDYNPNETE